MNSNIPAEYNPIDPNLAKETVKGEPVPGFGCHSSGIITTGLIFLMNRLS